MADKPSFSGPMAEHTGQTANAKENDATSISQHQRQQRLSEGVEERAAWRQEEEEEEEEGAGRAMSASVPEEGKTSGNESNPSDFNLPPYQQMAQIYLQEQHQQQPFTYAYQHQQPYYQHHLPHHASTTFSHEFSHQRIPLQQSFYAPIVSANAAEFGAQRGVASSVGGLVMHQRPPTLSPHPPPFQMTNPGAHGGVYFHPGAQQGALVHPASPFAVHNAGPSSSGLVQGRRQGQRRGMGRAYDAFPRTANQSVSAGTSEQQTHRFTSDRSVDGSMEGSASVGRQSHPSSKGTSISSGTGFLPAKPDFVAYNVPQPETSEGDDGGAVKSIALGSTSGLRRTLSYTAQQSGPTVPYSLRFPPMPVKPKTVDMNAQELMSLFDEREQALLMRVEAIGFEPEAAWRLFCEAQGQGQGQVEDDGAARETAAPVLGLRLLQRVDSLQRENAELGQLLGARLQGRTGTKESSAASSLQSELNDAHDLISKLDEALYACRSRAEAAEANIASLERALSVACVQNSSAMTAAQLGEDVGKQSTSAPQSNASPNPSTKEPTRRSFTSSTGRKAWQRSDVTFLNLLIGLCTYITA